MAAMIDGWPLCERCGGPVDALESMEEDDGSVVFAAVCHGAREETRLSMTTMLFASHIRFDVAFRKPPPVKIYDGDGKLICTAAGVTFKGITGEEIDYGVSAQVDYPEGKATGYIAALQASAGTAPERR